MYTNELLEEKYKVQAELFQIAEGVQESYLDLIEKYVKELYKERNWKLVYSKRRRGYEVPGSPQ